MANFPNQQLTNGGWDALSEALAGKTLKFVRMAVGDGDLPAGTDLADRTDLIHYIQDVPIVDYRAAGQGKMFLTGNLRSSQLATGFYLREIGVYVTVDDGPEILYSLNNAGNQADYIPSKDEGSVVIQAIEIQVLISKAEHVTVEILLGEVGVTGENIGGGAGVFIDRQGNRLRYRTLVGKAGTLPIEIEEVADTISIGVALEADGNGSGGIGGDDGILVPPSATGPSIGIVETGMIVPYAGEVAPLGYLICNGREVSRTGFSRLFGRIGTRHGAGNGTTTFNIPDCRDRALYGVGTLFSHVGHRAGNHQIVLTVANMPSHAHTVDINHYHTISVNDHNHPDPAHNHTFNQGWHGHSFTMQNKYAAHWIGTGYAAEVAGTSNTAGNWSGGYNSAAGSGLWNAGALGGTTAWLSGMATNWHLRGTDSAGENTPVSITSPGLGINYIIKT